MKYYPVYLNLKEKTVLVVGGGSVAFQKIPALLASGASIRLVAPEAVRGIEKLAEERQMEWLRRPYESSDLKGVALVIAATDDGELQKRIAAGARARKIWVNVVDVTPLCDFIAPSVISRGDLQIAISTGGASPALAKMLRKKLEPIIGAEYAELVRLLRQYRPDILKLPKQKRDSLWDTIVSPAFLNQIKARGAASAEAQLKEWIYHGKSAV